MLGVYATKFGNYQFTKVGQLTPRDAKEGAKIILKFLFVTRKRVFKKNQRAIRKEEKKRESLIFDFGCIGCQSMPQHLLNINLQNMVCRLQETLVKEKNFFWSYTYMLYMFSKSKAIFNKKRALRHRKICQKWLTFEFGCTGWKSTAQNLVIIDLPNLFGWL